MILEKKLGSVTISFCSQYPLEVIALTNPFSLPWALLLVLQFLPPAAWSCQLQDAAIPLVFQWEWSPGEETLPGPHSGCAGAALECVRALAAQRSSAMGSALLDWGQRFLLWELTESFAVVSRENDFFFLSFK